MHDLLNSPNRLRAAQKILEKLWGKFLGQFVKILDKLWGKFAGGIFTYEESDAFSQESYSMNLGEFSDRGICKQMLSESLHVFESLSDRHQGGQLELI